MRTPANSWFAVGPALVFALGERRTRVTPGRRC